MNLKDIDTKDLVSVIGNRNGVKSMNIKEDETYRVRAAGKDNSNDRYIRVNGPATILFVNEEEH